MMGMSLRADSRIVRWVEHSWIYRSAIRAPRPSPSVLENSAVLRVARRVPRAYALLVAVGAVVAAGSAILGHGVVSVMAVALVASALFPHVALLLVPCVFIWAPRLNLGVAGDEALFVRLDQAVVAGLLCFVVLHPRGRLRTPPGHTVFLSFLLVLLLSVIVGLARGTMQTPVSALLYLGQWMELYALFVVAYSLVCSDSKDHVQPWLPYAWALPLIALAAYGLAEQAWPYYEVPGVRYRTFERIWFPGQANHAGGLFAFATVTGLAMATQARYRVLGFSLAALSTLALFPTGSRSGAVAWAAGLGALALVYVRAFRWWLPPLGVLALFCVPGAWWQQMAAPGSSMYDRLVAWKSALSTVHLYRLLGLGAGARHRSYYDNHYLMTLSESGLLGATLLVLLLIALGHALAHRRIANGPFNWWYVGALAGLGALSVHALATATFIVTMVAGPFFWFAGISLAQSRKEP